MRIKSSTINAGLIGFGLLVALFVVLVVPAMAPQIQSYRTSTPSTTGILNFTTTGILNFTTFDAAKAVLFGGILTCATALIFHWHRESGGFLLRIFVAAMLIRVLIGSLIFAFQGREFFGVDALGYDYYGMAQLEAWRGERYYSALIDVYFSGGLATAWGMVKVVAAIYAVLGRNPLAVQMFTAVTGAATAPVIYLCASHVFRNARVARFSALAVAFYPSLVLWSAQGLKDGPTVFFLAVSILATIKLGDKFSWKYLVILILSLISVLALRFYIFYMIVAAVGGAFLIGMQKLSPSSFARQFAIIVIVGLALTYLGVTRYANVHLSLYTKLERVQESRLDAASANSGYGRDIDVSTEEGALKTIPIGLVYLLFAPFPWQLTSLRQSITLPEMIIWWASFPLLILGLWFAIRYRLRQISPVLIFTVMLSLAYSIFQGNVGNAYRQRSQLLVFYFIFVAVGLVLLLEKREEGRRNDLKEVEPLPVRLATSEISRR